jgi:hypothetical protein
VPARGGETFEDRFLGCSFVEMKGLRIELGRETLDIVSGDFELHPCVYRKLKLERSDGEVRQGWRVI